MDALTRQTPTMSETKNQNPVGAWLIVGLVAAASALCFLIAAYVFIARGS